MNARPRQAALARELEQPVLGGLGRHEWVSKPPAPYCPVRVDGAQIAGWARSRYLPSGPMKKDEPLEEFAVVDFGRYCVNYAPRSRRSGYA